MRHSHRTELAISNLISTLEQQSNELLYRNTPLMGGLLRLVQRGGDWVGNSLLTYSSQLASSLNDDDDDGGGDDGDGDGDGDD